IGIKIYQDRSKRLIGLSQSVYMDKILKRFMMDNSKRGYIPMQEKLDLNKTQGASTPEKVNWKSSKQSTTAVFAIEAVYIAALEVGMMCPSKSHDIHKMNIGLPQLTRLSLYGSASLGESCYVFILNGGELEELQAKYYCSVRYRSCIHSCFGSWDILLRRLYLKENLLNMLGAWDFV
nr:retrotransposon protein, putative, Ty1-copia subclass [Tanacetum cinerariifolium]